MAKNPFRSRTVPGPLKKEFEARADGTKLLKWTAERFPWIYVLTCAKGCGGLYDELGNDPTAPKGALRLFDINPSVGAYETGKNVPLPGITGLDVKAMGSLGTTRKATLKLLCFTDDQLIELQKCYFIPGMDVRVQWGWNKSCDGSTPPPPLDNSTEPCSNGTTLSVCRLNKQRKANSNIDGFQGIVGNFKYSLTKDNTWEISIEILSAADPFTKSKVGNTSCDCAREIETDEGETIKDFGPVYAALSDIHNDGDGAATRLMGTLMARQLPTNNHFWCSIEYEGVARTEVAADKDGSFWSGWFNGEEATEHYISFGAFIDMLNVMSIPNMPNEQTGNKWPYGKIDSSNVRLPIPRNPINIPIAMSADPRICYLGGGWLSDDVFNRKESGTIPNCISGNEIILDRIMCNVPFLTKEYKQVYDGNGSLKTLVDNVLTQINQVCGSTWNFVTVSTESDCGDGDSTPPPGPTITMLDEKQKMEATTPFNIPSLVGDSTLRDFSLNMKMTGAMKTQALYAGNNQKAKGGGGNDSAGCEGAAMSPFYIGQDVQNKAKPKPSTASVDCNDCSKGDKHTAPPTFNDLLDNMSDEINGQTVNAMRAWLEKQLSDTSSEGCAGVPLPFDFGFTVDGVSGFEFGQMITSSRIPAAVRDNFRWQVTKVEHSITANDWETSVSTVCRSNPFGTAPKASKAR